MGPEGWKELAEITILLFTTAVLLVTATCIYDYEAI